MISRRVVTVATVLLAIVTMRITLDLRADARESDASKITRAIDATVAAAERKDVGALMQFVSPLLAANGLTAPQIRALVARQLHDVDTVEVTYAPHPPHLRITGNSAEVRFDTLSVTFGSALPAYNRHGMTISMAKEKAPRYLVFHRSVWRLVSADPLPELPASGD